MPTAASALAVDVNESMDKPVTVSGIVVASGEIASGELVDGMVVEQPSADAVQRKVHGLLRDGLHIVSVAEGESYMRSITTEQKAVGKWAGYHTCYPKRRGGLWANCPGGVFGAWFVPCECAAGPCLWTPICPICCFPCCCYCERAPDTGAFIRHTLIYSLVITHIPGFIRSDRDSKRGDYGEYQGQYLLLDHERGTIGCYNAVCCTDRLIEEPDCYCVRRGALSTSPNWTATS